MNRLLMLLILAGAALPGGGLALVAAPRNEEVSPQSSGTEASPEQAAQTLFARMAESAGLLGKGSVRVIVLPVSLLQSRGAIERAAAEVGPFEEETAEAAPEPEPSYWFPNVMVEGTLTDRAALEDEIARLLRTGPEPATRRPGMPSAALMAVFESSQKAARAAELTARNTLPEPTVSRGETLGRGVPWKGGGSAKPEQARKIVDVAPRRLVASNPTRREVGAGKSSAETAERPAPTPVQEVDPKPERTTEDRYVAVLVQAPFHAFGDTPDETIAIELPGDAVGRVRGKGQDWAWVQLDSGLMGVIRNRFLREAAPGEIEKFLALEDVPGGGGGPDGLDIGIMDLDAFGHLIQSDVAPEGGEKVVAPRNKPEGEKGKAVEARKNLE